MAKKKGKEDRAKLNGQKRDYKSKNELKDKGNVCSLVQPKLKDIYRILHGRLGQYGFYLVLEKSLTNDCTERVGDFQQEKIKFSQRS